MLTKQEILEKLQDDKEYYGKFGKQYMSNSDIWTLLKEPHKVWSRKGRNCANGCREIFSRFNIRA